MSDRGFNFVTVKRGTNKSEDFVIFLKQLCVELKSFTDGFIEDVILVFDGAPIHKTFKCRDKISELGLRGLMMHSHSPGKLHFILLLTVCFIEMNAAEHFIRNHKSIIRRDMSYLE